MRSSTQPDVTVAETLVDVLRARADHTPDRCAYTFLADGEEDEESITYAALDRRARAIAARLQARGLTDGRALLLYPPGLDYIAAFFACLYAGVTAVPAYPPRRNRSFDRIDSIVADAQATAVLATQPILSMIERHFAEHEDLSVLHQFPTDTLGASDAEAWSPPGIDADTLAFLQYTSGSTGTPKGVMVSHGNLLHNQSIIQAAFQTDADAKVCSWLPLYHDMGLIGTVLHPLYVGGSCVLMPSVCFLQKPVRWLRAISRHRATISGGPDFAYALCARKITPDQCEGLDLSSWDVAFNGAEPVRAETLDRFTHAFTPYRFRREAFLPCYGLAEATLFVTGTPRTDAPRVDLVKASALEDHHVLPAVGQQDDARPLVSSGRTWDGLRLQIVDPETNALCSEGQVGEIWVSGASVTQGYWQQPEATELTFGARPNGSQNGAALRTGDLGFLRDGELFVTGRLKDLIIIRGRNHYPQDIEETVAKAHPALRPSGGAALAWDVEGQERLAVVHEVRRSALRDLDARPIIDAIRRAVSETHALQVHTVSLLKTGGLPKTTSGKIQRTACRVGLRAGTLPEVARDTLDVGDEDRENAIRSAPSHDAGPEAIAEWLRHRIAKAMRLPADRLDPTAPLSALGLDSLDAVELKLAIETDLGVDVALEHELADLSIEQLAQDLAGRSPSDRNLDDEVSESGGGDLFAKCDTDGGYFGAYRVQKDRYFTQPILEGPVGPHMRFQGREVIVWSINNYLGIAHDGRVHGRAMDALDEHGPWSPMGSRFMTGTTERHLDLERNLARYLDKEAAIVWNYGYMGVMGTIAA
ncbi:MAG: AMP-binding protein, partial [Bacteroidetes bacterium]|nr:AMP-binding protein [Bacteroidota bacterium]